MNSLIVLSVLGLVACIYALPNVVQFEMEAKKEADNLLGADDIDLERSILANLGLLKPKVPLRVGKFSWNSCKVDVPLAEVQELSLTPDPIATPGPLNVSVKATVKQDIMAPLNGNITIEKKVEEKYIKLPCIQPFGSCTYSDLCIPLDSVDCPAPLKAIGIDCRCPIKAKVYKTLQPLSFDIMAAALPKGDYRMTAVLSKMNKEDKLESIACLTIGVSFV